MSKKNTLEQLDLLWRTAVPLGYSLNAFLELYKRKGFLGTEIEDELERKRNLLVVGILELFQAGNISRLSKIGRKFNLIERNG